MKFTFAHNNINVLALEKSLAFYRSALDLEEVRRHEAKDGSFVLVFLGDGRTPHRLELTWLRDRKEPYNLGDNEMHLAFTVDDHAAAFAKHKEMGAVCYEN
ncbi:MAG TPA: VOC family protein, partial [Candidatus Latescibacteria bacterium]|nr:VOC family protein [Candidatus Latescibacterota bacterium]